LGISIAEKSVAVSEEAVRVTRAQRMPTIGLNSTYGLVNYNLAPALGDFRTNWTVGAAVQVPLFTGGRVKADEAIARADVEEARLRLKLARELSVLDEASARQELLAARAAWEATAGTVRQAQRAHDIADLRYREGLSTQLELSDARLLRQQAEVNRAVAGRDLLLARVRLALLPELPLTTVGGGGAAAASQRLNTALSAFGTFAQPTAVTTGRSGGAGAQQR
jgi:outer membrane protein TolC